MLFDYVRRQTIRPRLQAVKKPLERPPPRLDKVETESYSVSVLNPLGTVRPRLPTTPAHVTLRAPLPPTSAPRPARPRHHLVPQGCGRRRRERRRRYGRRSAGLGRTGREDRRVLADGVGQPMAHRGDEEPSR